MKDAKGHGSNSRGIATAAGYGVVQRPPLGHFIQSPTGEEHGPYFAARGAWKDAARLATTAGYANDLGAGKMLASGAKSAAAPVHDSMARAAGQSDRSYIAQRLTGNAEKSAGMERAPGESDASYIKRRIS